MIINYKNYVNNPKHPGNQKEKIKGISGGRIRQKSEIHSKGIYPRQVIQLW